MKICGVDKSKHGRIPFHVSSRRSFVRSNSARWIRRNCKRCERSALHNPLIAIFREKSFKKKKGSTKSREYRHRNRSSVNLPSFLLVGMRQNVCRLPGSVSIRSVLKSTEESLVDFRSIDIDNVDIFLDRVMLIQKLSNENDEKNKIRLSWQETLISCVYTEFYYPIEKFFLLSIVRYDFFFKRNFFLSTIMKKCTRDQKWSSSRKSVKVKVCVYIYTLGYTKEKEESRVDEYIKWNG